MATEDRGLTRRSQTVDTVRTLLSPESSTADRTRAGIKAVLVGGTVIGGGVVGIDELFTNAGGLMNTVWAAGEPGILAGGIAVTVGGIATGLTRWHEAYEIKQYGFDDSDAAFARTASRTVYRGVGAASVVIGGVAAMVAAGLMGGDLSLGLPDTSNAVHVLNGIAEGFGAAGAVSLGLGGYWHRRIQSRTPQALGE